MRKADADRTIADVGRRVGELRAARGLTQERLAADAGFSLKYLQRVEAGGQNLTLRSLINLANLLGVAAVDLLAAPSTRRPSVGRPPKAGSK